MTLVDARRWCQRCGEARWRWCSWRSAGWAARRVRTEYRIPIVCLSEFLGNSALAPGKVRLLECHDLFSNHLIRLMRVSRCR